MFHLFILFLGLSISRDLHACALRMAEAARLSPRTEEFVRELFETQRALVMERLHIFLGNAVGIQGFPFSVRAPRIEQCLEVVEQRADSENVQDLLGETPISPTYLQDLFRVVYTQFLLARTAVYYQHEVQRLGGLPVNSFSAQYKLKLFKTALVDAAFYQKPGMTNTKAFGFEVPMTPLGMAERSVLRLRVPPAVRQFLDDYDAFASNAGLRPGREYFYYLALLRRTWPSK